MSKQTGNFLTLYESVSKFSADATRIALADAGDGVDDANFVEKTADSVILRITTLIELIKSIVKDCKDQVFRSSKIKFTFLDRWFDASMNSHFQECSKAMDKLHFRMALKSGFYDFYSLYGLYSSNLGNSRPHSVLAMKFARFQTLQLCPFAPHTCEYLWSNLGKSGLCIDEPWPEAEPIDVTIIKSGSHLFSITRELRILAEKYRNPKKGQSKVLYLNNLDLNILFRLYLN